MGLLYQRNARVTFGRAGQAGRAITGLKIVFNFEKNSESSSNKGTIDIFNMNADSRALAEEKDIIVLLEVGYQGGLEQLAVGDVLRATSMKRGPNWITTFEFGDGENALKTNINKSFAPGSTTDQIVREVVKDIGKGIETLKGFGAKIFENGFSVSGSVEEVMSKLTEEEDEDVEFSIQDDKVQALKAADDTGSIGFIISPETGLIGSPIKKKAKKDTKAFDGIVIECLMIPSLKPGKRFQLESQLLSGVYRVRKAQYQGDTRAGPFMITVEATEVPTITIDPGNVIFIPSDQLNLA